MSRVRIADVDDDFLRIIQKKYRGRFYSKNKTWSFPTENLDKIRQEWSEYRAEHQTHDKATQTEQFYVHDIPSFYKNQFKKYLDS